MADPRENARIPTHGNGKRRKKERPKRPAFLGGEATVPDAPAEGGELSSMSQT